ncbi:MAG: hypothetical protein WDM79_01090 [Terricaulis sp.]
MQPAEINPGVTFDGLTLNPALARTNAPIVSGDEETVIFVEGEGRASVRRGFPWAAGPSMRAGPSVWSARHGNSL